MKSNEKNLMQKTADDIIQYIIDHNMKPGDKVPTEPELSQLLNAGRSTIREAMRTLATRNIVEVRQGSGTYISGKMGMIEDPFGLFFIDDKEKLMRDLMNLRIQVEPDIAAMAATNATDNDLETIKTCLEDIELLIYTKQDFTEADNRFHQAIANSANNLVSPRLIPLFSTVSRYIKEEDEETANSLIASHREIYEAIASKDPVSAKDCMYLHLVQTRRLLSKK
ncbi:MAG: FadR/GntR family transcriptional regulator [bacterium]|nr:FadR/GntR family transcriptional regulator [bacterium]